MCSLVSLSVRRPQSRGAAEWANQRRPLWLSTVSCCTVLGNRCLVERVGGGNRIGLTRWVTMAESDERGRERLGRRVVSRRKELGLSLREAARRAKVMRATWTGLEQGSRRT